MMDYDDPQRPHVGHRRRSESAKVELFHTEFTHTIYSYFDVFIFSRPFLNIFIFLFISFPISDLKEIK